MAVSNHTNPPFYLLSLIFFSFLIPSIAGADSHPRKLLTNDFRASVFTDAKSVTAFDSSLAPPPPSAPPPSFFDEKPVYSPFKPSILVLVGLLTGTFSITFLLLYAKHWKRGNVVVIGYTRHPNSVSFPASTMRKNSGIDQTVIDSLPVFRFGSLRGMKAEGLECAVCLNRFETAEILRLLPKCKHAFHVECVDTWLDAHSTCPLCRFRVDPEDVLLVEEEVEEEVDNLGHNRASISCSCSSPESASLGKEEPRRVSGRHSSVGEKRTNGYRIGESSNSRDPASFRRSLDSAGSRKKNETVSIGCFDRPRKDGLLLAERRNRFEHRIIVSGNQRWSDVQPSDLLYLRSEMIISESRRYSAASLPSELKRQRWIGIAKAKAGKSHGIIQV